MALASVIEVELIVYLISQNSEWPDLVFVDIKITVTIGLFNSIRVDVVAGLQEPIMLYFISLSGYPFNSYELPAV